MGGQVVEIAVLIDQFGRRLLPHPGNAGQIVRRIAAESGQKGVVDRPHAGPLLDSRFVVEGVVAHTPAVVEHPDERVLHQLIGVTVAGDHDHRLLAVAGLGGQGGQHVVGFETDGSDHRDGQCVEQGADHVELRG